MNAAVCDDAVRIDEKVAVAKEERRYSNVLQNDTSPRLCIINISVHLKISTLDFFFLCFVKT